MENLRHLTPPATGPDHDPGGTRALERPQPHDPEAERAVLGGLLLNNQLIPDIVDTLASDDFYRPAHTKIYDTVVSLHTKGDPADPITVCDALTKSGDLAKVGGAGYVHQLAATYSPAAADYYADIVHDHACRRAIIRIGHQLLASAYAATDDDPDTLLTTARTTIDHALTSSTNTAHPSSRLISGGTFILDRPDTVPALWGEGDQVLWAEGEALLIAGPAGVGKTTVAQQVILAMIGIRPHALGMAVRPAKKVLYLASDRPQQAARSMQRMVTPDHRALLDEHLAFWPGPPPAQFVADPETLLRLCRQAGADVVVLDSLKDMTGELAKEEGGQAINSAIQRTLVEGIEVLGLHHHRKQGGGKDGGKEPTTLDELYGSTWITAGAGSVISLWGAAGDPIVSLRHLKQPAAEAGPWRLKHDHPRGSTEIWHQVDVLHLLRTAGPDGLSPAALAVNLFPNPGRKPSSSEVEKARRRLDTYVEQRLAVVKKLGSGRTAKTAYFAAFDEQGELPS